MWSSPCPRRRRSRHHPTEKILPAEHQLCTTCIGAKNARPTRAKLRDNPTYRALRLLISDPCFTRHCPPSCRFSSCRPFVTGTKRIVICSISFHETEALTLQKEVRGRRCGGPRRHAPAETDEALQARAASVDQTTLRCLVLLRGDRVSAAVAAGITPVGEYWAIGPAAARRD